MRRGLLMKITKGPLKGGAMMIGMDFLEALCRLCGLSILVWRYFFLFICTANDPKMRSPLYCCRIFRYRVLALRPVGLCEKKAGYIAMWVVGIKAC